MTACIQYAKNTRFHAIKIKAENHKEVLYNV